MNYISNIWWLDKTDIPRTIGTASHQVVIGEYSSTGCQIIFKSTEQIRQWGEKLLEIALDLEHRPAKRDLRVTPEEKRIILEGGQPS